ncbi:signal peptide peptidase SppA [Piscinibacter koreensis]|uniref:Signal peptide peptidase SppA n=1 Tax=Piscinibacter koreensis TaxID=2742824 RepID=A0A7Y6TUN2_9BURK|nr:signal peptide peptidase SppA [Schlegelella koreensis]NUZ04160.1 signal peptide peptidase SppA [Schlegelella koreensis]
MPSSKPGRIRRWFGALWWFLDAGRRVAFTLLFWLIVLLILIGLVQGGPPALADRTALVLDLEGPISEQTIGNVRSTALDQLRGGRVKSVRLRDVLEVLDRAAADPKIARVVLLLDEMQGTGLASLHEIGAAIDRFKSTGKQVVAWGSGYDQRQYYLAARANEVYMHPMGALRLEGYGRHRNYYRDALDKLGISVNLLRVGTYKNAAEPFVASQPSPESLEADAALYGSMWTIYTADVERARRLPAGAIARSIEEAPERLMSAGGDQGRAALADKLVDGLKTRDELGALMRERGAADAQGKTFAQVSFESYLARIKPAVGGDAVGVVVAEGDIVDGSAPAGTIGGLSTSALIRQARDDRSIKALVLRVNSPGGSVFGSELVRRELELTRRAGKPVVVSMGDVAASGGYWISTASDEVIADPGTITGSIGVFALLPTAERAFDRLGIQRAGVTTTWLRDAGDPRLPLDPRYAALVQTTIDHVYAEFVGKVAAARKSTPAAIDTVAQGRVWTGAQAKERGLVDRLGGLSDALRAAAQRAKLPADARVTWIEREPGKLARALSLLNGGIAELVGGPLGPLFGAETIAPAAAREVVRDLGWLGELTEQRKAYSAVTHCLCGP